MALVSRDPFARTEVHREIVKVAGLRPCDWCGGDGRLFRYRTESDGGSKNDHKGLFCSKSCHDSYHS